MRVLWWCGGVAAGIALVFLLTHTPQEKFFRTEKIRVSVSSASIPLLVVRAPASQIRMRAVITAHAPQLVSALSASEESVVINGSYFDAQYEPSGFVAAGGVRSSRLFDRDKSGAIFYDGAVHIADALRDDFLRAPESVQSYPLLIRDGEPLLQTDSGRLARRTAVGLDRAGNIVVIIADEQEISLYEFAHAMAQLQPQIVTAMNLDGGPSSGMVVRTGGSTTVIDSITPVGTAIIFEKLP